MKISVGIPRFVMFIIYTVMICIVSIPIIVLADVIIADVTCSLQANDTYTCNVKQRITDIDYPISEKQIENVVGIRRDATNGCRRGCSWRVEFELTSGETTPVKYQYGDADMAWAMVEEVSNKMKNKEQAILYTLGIDRFWGLYFPISLAAIIWGSIILAIISNVIKRIRYGQ